MTENRLSSVDKDTIDSFLPVMTALIHELVEKKVISGNSLADKIEMYINSSSQDRDNKGLREVVDFFCRIARLAEKKGLDDAK